MSIPLHQPSGDDFRALAENLPALCWMARADGWVFWYNRQWYEYTGATPGEMVGWGWTSVHNPNELAAVLKRWKEAIATGSAFEMVLSLRGKDGIYSPFLTRVVPFKDENGRIIRWFGKSTDVSKLYETEAALRDSEARYRSAMALGRMASWETNYLTRTRKWTAEGMVLFGLGLVGGIGEVGGDNDEFLLALHPADRHLHRVFRDLEDRKDSFPAEYRIVRPDGQTRWMSGYGRVIDRGSDGKARRLVNVVTDITERKAMEERSQFLLRELSHRSKNLLSVVQAIVGLTVRNSESLQEFANTFSDRLRGLAASNHLLTDNDWNGAALDQLVGRQLAPFVELPSSRVRIAGPELVVTADATQSIGLALHELTTNAVKYGALSSPSGKVEIVWDIEGAEGEAALRLGWTESGGPPVAEPKRKGFGQVVIKQMIEQALSASVTIVYASSGVQWTLTTSLSNVIGSAGKR
jgi:PAS domain S-box-containing protein